MEQIHPDTPQTDLFKFKGGVKFCGVCGDKALGYNFNAITCESCKAFFRRNALKNKEFHCPFSKRCSITVLTRRFCQRCRLEKCKAIGMKSEFIMSEEEKVKKRKKIEENRAKKRPHIEDQNTLESNQNSEGWNYCKQEVHEESITSPVIEDPDDDEILGESCVEISAGGQENHKHKIQCEQQYLDLRSTEPASPYNGGTGDIHHLSATLPSPTSATSVPSPSSPSDSATVKNLENCNLLTKSIPGDAIRLTKDVIEILSEDVKKSSAVQFQQHKLISNFCEAAVVNNETPLLSSLISNISSDEPKKSSNYLISNFSTSRSTSSSSGLSYQNSWSSNNSNDTIEILQDIRRIIPAAPSSIESILSEAIKLEYEAYSSLAKSHQNSRELNDAERAKLNELIVANKGLHDPMDDDLSNLVGDDCRFKTGTDQSPMILDVINLTAIAIRRLIKSSKKINAFRNMCQEDQVALLKGGCTEILILRSVMNYDPDKNSWKIPHSQQRLNLKVDVLKKCRGKIYEEHQRFLRSFDPQWRMDESIMLILCAITLFTPDRPRVVHQDVIKLEQNSYYYLLRRYLESIYSGCEARSTFLKLIQKISELHRLNDEHVKVYLNVNPQDVEPLLIEIFDLKPH